MHAADANTVLRAPEGNRTVALRSRV